MKRLLLALTLTSSLVITGCTTGANAPDSPPTPTKPPAPVPTLSLPYEEHEEEEEENLWDFDDDFSFSVEQGTLEEVKVYPKEDAEKDREKRQEEERKKAEESQSPEPSSTDSITPAESSVPTESAEPAQAGGEVENTEPAPVLETPTGEPTETPTEEPAVDFNEFLVEEDPSEDIDEKFLLEGEFSEDETSWEDSEKELTPNTEYQWVVSTEDGDGKLRYYTDTVKTRELKKKEKSKFRSNIADDQTVGVAAPIIITFNTDVDEDYRDDVEERLKVTTNRDEEVEGSWGWLADDAEGSRLHYRTKEFWPADTEVKAELPLENVRVSDDKWGTQNMTLDFTIGRKQEVVADAKSKRMRVYRDGEEIHNFPASLGSAKSPSYNGTHVVMSKHRNYTLTSERWGYSTPTEYAVRIHNNGEFIHAAPWSVGSQGRTNVSHGCVNLTTARAKEYYDSAIYGDPVEVKNSSVDLSKNASDISDWVYSWEEWQELSALENNDED